MQLKGRQIEAFVRRPEPGIRAVLVYGPDAGLVSERIGLLAKSVPGAVEDPFRYAELSPASLKDRAALNDEAAALSLTGGRRVIVVIMGSLGPGGQVDKGKTRDLKAVELIERGFAAMPAGGPPFASVKPVDNSPMSLAPQPPTIKHAAPTEATQSVIKFSIPGAKK